MKYIILDSTNWKRMKIVSNENLLLALNTAILHDSKIK